MSDKLEEIKHRLDEQQAYWETATDQVWCGGATDDVLWLISEVERLRAELAELGLELHEANREVERLRLENRVNLATIAYLKDQIKGNVQCSCMIAKYGFEESRVDNPLCLIHGESPKREVERLRADLALAKEVRDEHVGLAGVCNEEVEKLRFAIKRVLDDEESRPGGWGPDVTMLEVLRKALRGEF